MLLGGSCRRERSITANLYEAWRTIYANLYGVHTVVAAGIHDTFCKTFFRRPVPECYGILRAPRFHSDSSQGVFVIGVARTTWVRLVPRKTDFFQPFLFLMLTIGPVAANDAFIYHRNGDATRPIAGGWTFGVARFNGFDKSYYYHPDVYLGDADLAREAGSAWHVAQGEGFEFPGTELKRLSHN